VTNLESIHQSIRLRRSHLIVKGQVSSIQRYSLPRGEVKRLIRRVRELSRRLHHIIQGTPANTRLAKVSELANAQPTPFTLKEMNLQSNPEKRAKERQNRQRQILKGKKVSVKDQRRNLQGAIKVEDKVIDKVAGKVEGKVEE